MEKTIISEIKDPYKMLECSNCKYTFDEPKHSIGMECPKCGDWLFIPSRNFWETMKSNSDFN